MRMPVGRERRAGSFDSITGRDDLILMTGERGRPGDGCKEDQAAMPSGAASRPNSEFEPARSITTFTMSPI